MIKGFRRNPQLTNNFSGGQISGKTLLASGAETAVQGAADLRGDTESAAVALGNIDHFDAATAIDLDQPFACAIDRVLTADNLWHNDFGHFGQAFAQAFRNIGHLTEIINSVLMNPFENLGATETLLTQGL